MTHNCLRQQQVMFSRTVPFLLDWYGSKSSIGQRTPLGYNKRPIRENSWI
jgi:hypothetical protein